MGAWSISAEAIDDLTKKFGDLKIAVKKRRPGRHTLNGPTSDVSHAPSRNGLLGLPNELLNAILLLVSIIPETLSTRDILIQAQIRHPADQAVLVRTCKKLGGMVLPMLYHELKIDVSISNDRDVLSKKGRPNPGLEHMRHLTLTQSVEKSDNTVLSAWLHNLVGILKPNTLQSLRCDQRVGELDVVWPLLSIFQKALSSTFVRDRRELAGVNVNQIDLHGPNRNIRWYLKRMAGCETATFWLDDAIMGSHENARYLASVQCKPDGAVTMEVLFHGSRQVIWRRMTNLFIRLLDSICATCQQSGLSQELLCRCSNNSSLKALCLRSASFWRDFQIYSHWWSVALLRMPGPHTTVVAGMTSLILQDCCACAELLSALSHGSRHLSLRVLVLVSRREDIRRADFRAILDKVLKSFSGLRTLVLSARDQVWAPSSSALACHAATLKEYYFDAFGEIDSPRALAVYASTFVRALCSTCRELEQVAIPLEPHFLDTAVIPTVSTKRFSPNVPKINADARMRMVEDNMTAEKMRKREEYFEDVFASLATLPKLRTLRVFTAMTIAPTESFRRFSKDIIAMRLEKLAYSSLGAFHRAGQNSISVIAFGRPIHKMTLTCPVEGVDPKLTTFVIQNAKGSSWLEKCKSMKRVDHAKAKYYEPCSELLDIEHESPYFLRFPRLQ